MLVTLFTDASVRHTLSAAGWGAWCRGDNRQSRTFSGMLGAPGPDGRTVFTGHSNTAELLAVTHAMEALHRSDYLVPADDVVMVQSDCLGALAILGTHLNARFSSHPEGSQFLPRRQKGLIRLEKAAVARIENVLKERGMSLVVRHVKGHTEGDGRNWVNRECDRLANLAAEAAAGLRAPHGSMETGT